MIRKVTARIQLSRAKHRSIQGHAKLALRLARFIRGYSHTDVTFFSCDGAPPQVQRKRRDAFDRLERFFTQRFSESNALTDHLRGTLSDLAFVDSHRTPFPFQSYVSRHLKIPSIAVDTDGPLIRDIDGNRSFDLGGSYGVNLFGSEFYKHCIDRAVQRARPLGLVLGSYHPMIADNVLRLREISGLDEISFHMSGTEAVMQAVRLARYHTRKRYVVKFAGAYHGWWEGVQTGIGNPRPTRDTFTLKEMSPDTLRVLKGRNDVACVLVNPIQAMHPNSIPPSDSALLTGRRSVAFNKETYGRWLLDLRQVCSDRSIAFILDEVFLGFRLARGGAQEYFGVHADLVTYGKSLGGGLPVGVVCGKAHLMRRFEQARPLDICFARGTFNSHPYVMSAMNEFLRYLDTPEIRASYNQVDTLWNGRAKHLNARLEQLSLPVRVANMTSVWTTLYSQPGRYHWMFQYYLRAEGLSLSWIGTGRFIFSHDLTDGDFENIAGRFVKAAQAMQADGWWWTDAALTETAIKRRMIKEIVNAALGRAPSDPAVAPSEEITEPCGTSSRRETDPSVSW